MHPHVLNEPGSDPNVADPLALLTQILDLIQEIHQFVTSRAKSHYTVEEIAHQVGRSEYTVRKWIKDGDISAIRVDGTGPRGRLLIPREEILRLVSQARGSRVSAMQIEPRIEQN